MVTMTRVAVLATLLFVALSASMTADHGGTLGASKPHTFDVLNPRPATVTRVQASSGKGSVGARLHNGGREASTQIRAVPDLSSRKGRACWREPSRQFLATGEAQWQALAAVKTAEATGSAEEIRDARAAFWRADRQHRDLLYAVRVVRRRASRTAVPASARQRRRGVGRRPSVRRAGRRSGSRGDPDPGEPDPDPVAGPARSAVLA